MTATAGLEEILSAGAIAGADTLPGLGDALRCTALGAPEAVVRPGSVEEVVRIVRWADETGVGILPVASGERARPALAGPSSGEGRWIALATGALTGIEVYEAADLTLTAGAGTPMTEIAAALDGNAQFAPFDPPAASRRTLGGLVADGASGPLWAGYGELRNHVLGMTVVTGDGRVLRLGGRVVKNVAGFDLLKPMTGGRGTLGVIASVCLRAFPRPAEDRLLVLRGVDVEALLTDALSVGTAPVLPVSSVLAASPAAGPAKLLVRLHGAAVTVDSDQASLERHVGRTFEVLSADEARAEREGARDAASSGAVVIEASVRPSRLAALWERVREATPAEVVVDTYAGRLRVAFEGVTGDRLAALTRATEELDGAVRVVRAGDGAAAAAGTPPSEARQRLTERLRRAFDPRGVMWPARR